MYFQTRSTPQRFPLNLVGFTECDKFAIQFVPLAV